MPVYEYFCLDCHKIFDRLRPMSQSDAPVRCEACESDKTRRMLSMFAAQTSSGGGESQMLGGGGGCGCGGSCGCGHSQN